MKPHIRGNFLFCKLLTFTGEEKDESDLLGTEPVCYYSRSGILIDSIDRFTEQDDGNLTIELASGEVVSVLCTFDQMQKLLIEHGRNNLLLNAKKN